MRPPVFRIGGNAAAMRDQLPERYIVIVGMDALLELRERLRQRGVPGERTFGHQGGEQHAGHGLGARCTLAGTARYPAR